MVLPGARCWRKFFTLATPNGSGELSGDQSRNSRQRSLSCGANAAEICGRMETMIEQRLGANSSAGRRTARRAGHAANPVRRED